MHQTRDSSSVDYDGFGFHSGGVSKTGVFTHRSVNVTGFAVSYCNDIAFCPDAINLDQVFRKLVNVDPGLKKLTQVLIFLLLKMFFTAYVFVSFEIISNLKLKNKKFIRKTPPRTCIT